MKSRGVCGEGARATGGRSGAPLTGERGRASVLAGVPPPVGHIAHCRADILTGFTGELQAQRLC